jgi:hypothetical protein
VWRLGAISLLGLLEVTKLQDIQQSHLMETRDLRVLYEE